MKKYEKYKDNGIPWIGKIPEHWEVVKLKYKFKFKTGFTPPSGRNEYYEDGTHIWINISDMQKKYIDDSEKKITDKAIEDFKPEIVPKGALLYSFKLSVGKVAFSLVDCYTNEAIFSILPNEQTNLNFYYYSLPEQLIKNANENIYGAKILNQELIKNAYLIVPPSNEQTSIANYLDRKTAQIDELIGKKERLLELYEEERNAVINHAVTKGVNPNVKLKDSGIPWLGKIPAHWEVKKLKYLGTIKYGLGQPPRIKLDGLPLIRATNIFRGKIDDKDMIFVDPNDIPYDRDPVLKKDDIIIVRSGAYTADSAIIPEKYEGAITGYDMAFRAYEYCNPKFISYCLLSDYVFKKQLLLYSLRAAQPHLNREDLGETIIIFPKDFEEQTAIVTYIEKQTAHIDYKIEKTKKMIELLKEYKTSLINEIVMGKRRIL